MKSAVCYCFVLDLAAATSWAYKQLDSSSSDASRLIILLLTGDDKLVSEVIYGDYAKSNSCSLFLIGLNAHYVIKIKFVLSMKQIETIYHIVSYKST